VFFPISLLGVGEMSVIIISQILITKNTPSEIRGSVSGIFSLFGGLGILVATKIGGIIFDSWKASGPFIFFGFLNLTLSCLCFVYLFYKLFKFVYHLIFKKSHNFIILNNQ
jgi:MFS family permease